MTIVSIRIPQSMIKQLKQAVDQGHFLDSSEAVRSVVRKKWLEWKDPSTYQIRKLRTDIKQAITEKSKRTKEERLLDELQRIKDMILNEEVQK